MFSPFPCVFICVCRYVCSFLNVLYTHCWRSWAKPQSDKVFQEDALGTPRKIFQWQPSPWHQGPSWEMTGCSSNGIDAKSRRETLPSMWESDPEGSLQPHHPPAGRDLSLSLSRLSRSHFRLEVSCKFQVSQSPQRRNRVVFPLLVQTINESIFPTQLLFPNSFFNTGS